MKKKRIPVILGAALILAIGAVLLSGQSSDSAQADAELGQVTRATLSSVVESSGSVIPESEISLSFDTVGTVVTVSVQPGDRVKAGEVLAQLGTSGLERQVAQAEQAYLIQQASYSMTVQPDASDAAAAQAALNNAWAAYQLAQQKYAAEGAYQVMTSCDDVDSAKKTYDDALTAYNNYLSDWRVQVYGAYEVSPQRAQLDRASAAYEQALASCHLAQNSASDDTSVKAAWAQVQSAQAALEDLINPSELTLATAQAQLDQARRALEQAQRQLDKASIAAPFDGVVTQVTAIAGGASSGASIQLADVSRYHVDILVDETEIAQVQAGQTAEITFDGLPDVTVTGVVNRVDPAGTINQGVVYYSVRVDLDLAEAALRLDMTANVRIILDTHADVLAVPGGALRSDGNVYYVNVVGADSLPQRVDVTTGYTDGDLTEVSGDLEEGQQVYIGEPSTTEAQQPGLNLFGIRIGGR
jgi:HlyD family secretion protein